MNHSPEWVAFVRAREIGARVRFIDLPGWAPAFEGGADLRSFESAGAPGRRFGRGEFDGLWDHLFEQPSELGDLRRGLARFFAELRRDLPVGPGDAIREAFMRQCVAATLAEARGDVLLVCGGFHAPVFDPEERADAWPKVPLLPGARVGSDLVPLSFTRLARIGGPEPGPPAPAFYDAVWRLGAEAAGPWMLEEATRQLRKAGHRISCADLVAASTLAEGLRRLRGHAALGRIDLLDAMAGTWLKEPLAAPLPWSTDAGMSPQTPPLVRDLVALFTGEHRGALHPSTPHPPLVSSLDAELKRLDLVPRWTVRTLRLGLSDGDDLERSHALHRLSLLDIPGFDRQSGPERPSAPQLFERWAIGGTEPFTTEVIEAARYGATLRAAAAGKLAESLRTARGRLSTLAWLLECACLAGIDAIAGSVAAEVAAAIGQERSLRASGGALGRLLALHRADSLFLPGGIEGSERLLAAAYTRSLWLLEDRVGPRAMAQVEEIAAVVTIRDTHLVAPPSGVDPLHGVAARKLVDRRSPPSLRGAALGVLWSTGYYEGPEDGQNEALRGLGAFGHTEAHGDFLAGLFALARDQILRAARLIEALDALVGGMSSDEFVAVLPALRMAFDFFPPAERAHLAQSVASLHRPGERAPAPRPSPFDGAALEAKVSDIARRYGLTDLTEPARRAPRPLPNRPPATARGTPRPAPKIAAPTGSEHVMDDRGERGECQSERHSARAESAEAVPWCPGAISDAQLAASLGRHRLARARAMLTGALSVHIEPGPPPRAQLPTCTVQFLAPRELAHAHCDCNASGPCEHVAVAVWAFRQGPEIRDSIEVVLGGKGPVLAETWEAALEQGRRVCVELLRSGVQRRPAAFEQRALAARERLAGFNLNWPADILAEMIELVDAYHSRATLYSKHALSRCVVDFTARHHAARAGGSVPLGSLLGNDDARETKMGRQRLICLGARLSGDAESRRVELYLATPGADTALVLRRRWEAADGQLPDGPQMVRRLVAPGVRLGALVNGQLVAETSVRRANAELVLPRSGSGRVSVLPQCGRWADLRAPLLVGVKELHNQWRRRPPWMVRPRTLSGNLRVLPVTGIDRLRDDPGDQQLVAHLYDPTGDAIELICRHRRWTLGAINAVSTALRDTRAPRFVAGAAFCQRDRDDDGLESIGGCVEATEEKTSPRTREY